MCESNNESMEIAISSWKEKFYKILDSATDTEGIIMYINAKIFHLKILL